MRITREQAINIINLNSYYTVDLGCGTNGACPSADIYVDIKDHSERFGKNFVQHDLNEPLPFNNNSFEFVWASHILEHVTDPLKFFSEILRICVYGAYIEVPTPLADNLVTGDDSNNPFGHKWWVTYDDWNHTIICKPKRIVTPKRFETPKLNELYPFFKQSFATGILVDKETKIAISTEEIYSYEGKSYDLSKSEVKVEF